MELKSTYPDTSLGLVSEILVVRKVLKQKKYKWISWRKKYFGIEVDLVFETSKHNICLVECKSLADWQWAEFSLNKKQRARQRFVQINLQDQGLNVSLCLARIKSGRVFFELV